jgi:RNA-directed DNA polymerase
MFSSSDGIETPTPGDVACLVGLGVCGFNVLGYTFRPRRSQNRWGTYVSNFSPAVTDKAGKAMRAEIRDWKLHLHSGKSIEDLSRMSKPKIRGWLHRFA